jgi:hypothetical protein
MRILPVAALVGGLALAGCDSFDPLDKFQDWDLMSSKKPLPGERRPVFPEGVPGVPQGVPPDMVKGYQPPPEAPPPVIEAKPARPKPKKTAAAPRRPSPPPQQTQEAPPPAPAARTTTQPVQQGAGAWPTMPGAQPTWPTDAQPAPTR